MLLAIYAPGGAEEALKGLPDYRELPPGEPPTFTGSVGGVVDGAVASPRPRR